jgi:hypothetical protein
MEHAPETIFGERGVQTAHNIANLALGRVSAVDLGPNYSLGAGGSIEVRFDAASAAVFADPDAYSAR